MDQFAQKRISAAGTAANPSNGMKRKTLQKLKANGTRKNTRRQAGSEKRNTCTLRTRSDLAGIMMP